MIKFVETVDVKKDDILAEIGQTLETRFAFLTKDKDGNYTNAHPFVKCRDFLGDALAAQTEKTTKSIYGFTFKGNEQSFLDDKMRLVIKYPTEQIAENTVKNVSKIHNIETIVGKIAKTKITVVPDDTKLLIIEGSKFWLKSIFLVSLYTYLIKCLGYKLTKLSNIFEDILEIGTSCGNEYDYAKDTHPTITLLLPKLRKIHKDLPNVSGWKNGTVITIIHNNSGFVSTIKWNKHASYLNENTLYQRINTILSGDK